MSSSFASHASVLVQRIQQRTTALEIVYKTHDRWPLRPGSTTAGPSRPTRISVLDSSFNPPTLAHLSLFKSAPQESSLDARDARGDAGDYDARLLLLSVRNADKSVKTGDASYVQRLQMMVLLAQTLEAETRVNSQATGADDSRVNAAVAIIDEPTFVRKSTVLLDFLKDRIANLNASESENPVPFPSFPPQLTFLLGFDTLERLVAPRYYTSPAAMLNALRTFFSPPPHGDGSRVVCAHRVPSEWLTLRTDANLEDEQKRERDTMEAAEEFIKAGSVTFIDLREKQLSSSEVRKRIREGYEWRAMVPTKVVEYISEEKLYH